MDAYGVVPIAALLEVRGRGDGHAGRAAAIGRELKVSATKTQLGQKG